MGKTENELIPDDLNGKPDVELTQDEFIRKKNRNLSNLRCIYDEKEEIEPTSDETNMRKQKLKKPR